MRPALQTIGQRHGANVKVVEVPPGPPVLSPLVAEIYGPEAEGRRQVAQAVRGVFARTEGVVDIDDSSIADAPRALLVVDRRKAATPACRSRRSSSTLRAGLAGEATAYLHDQSKYPAAATIQSPAAAHGDLDALLQLTVRSAQGKLVAIRELVTVSDTQREQPVHHKDLLPVDYVIADMAGQLDSPLYGMFTSARRRGVATRAAARQTFIVRRRTPTGAAPEMGRRVEDHLRNFPRHGHCLRRGPDPDLSAGGGAVRLPDAAHHHGADPADHHRRHAGPCAARRAVHRHQHDRHDRAGRHHRAQFDPAGGLHQPAVARRHGLQAGGGELPPRARSRSCSPERRPCSAPSSSSTTRSSTGWRSR